MAGSDESEPRMVSVRADDLEVAVLIAGLASTTGPNKGGDTSWLDRLCIALDADDE